MLTSWRLLECSWDLLSFALHMVAKSFSSRLCLSDGVIEVHATIAKILNDCPIEKKGGFHYHSIICLKGKTKNTIWVFLFRNVICLCEKLNIILYLCLLHQLITNEYFYIAHMMIDIKFFKLLIISHPNIQPTHTTQCAHGSGRERCSCRELKSTQKNCEWGDKKLL